MNHKSIFSKINKQTISSYQKHLEELALSESTIKRRLSSIRHFCEWSYDEGYLKENPFKITKRHGIRFRELPFTSELFRAYEQYHSISITKYLHYAILIIFCAALGFGIYDQFFRRAPAPLAYPPASALVTPNRYLSFQGRLTDSSDNPITSSTSFRFSLYNDLTASGSAKLWEEQRAITPDQDGIFSVVLGTNVAISASVFTDNASIWLGVTVSQDPEMTPRQQIATVGYALNAETLQGIPPSASPSANKIPIVTASGDLVLAGASPRVYSTSGTFGIKGQALSITTDTGTNGNITLAPDGTGVLNINLGGASGNQMRVTDANITSGSLVSVYAGTNATGFDLLNLSSGSSETEKFAVDYSGDVSLAGGDITGANSVNLDIGEASANYVTSSVGFAVGGGTTYYLTNAGTLNVATINAFNLAGNITVNQDIDIIPAGTTGTNDLGSSTYPWDNVYANNVIAPSTGSGQQGWWTRTAGVLSPVNLNDAIAATTSATRALTITQTGAFDVVRFEDEASDATPFVVDSSGQVGIGTTGPLTKLHISDSSVANIRLQDTETNGTSWDITSDVFGTTPVINFAHPAVADGRVVISDTGLGILVGGNPPVNTLNVNGKVAIGASYYGTAAPSNGMIIEGNVGIGTTGPLALLHLNDITNDKAYQLVMGYTNDYRYTVGRNYDGGFFEIEGNQASPNSGFKFKNPTGTLFTILGGGNVGIGTTAPDSKLHTVGGDVYVAPDTGYTFTNSSANEDLYVYGNLEVDGSSYLVGLTLSGDLRLNNNQILNSAGTATIIFSATPSTSYNTLDAGSWLVSNTANLGQAALMINQTLGGDIFTASASGTPKFVIQNDGDVGIGDATPDYLLDVAGNVGLDGDLTVSGGDIYGPTGDLQVNSYADLRLRMDADNNGLNYLYVFNGAGVSILAIDESGNMTMIDGSWIGLGSTAERIIFDGTGDDIEIMGADVGIGTTGPSAGLHVETAEKASGTPGAGVTISGGDSGNTNIELREDAAGGTPYIDFANDPSTTDYDIRLILTGDDTFDLQGGNLGVSGRINPGADANYYLLMSGSNPLIGFEANTYHIYDRTNDKNQWVINAIAEMEIRTTGVYADDLFNGNAWDYAENFVSLDQKEPGSVMCFSADVPIAVQECTQAQDNNLAGVISTKPGFLTGESINDEENDPNRVPIALVGRVPTKVNLENGPINIGDPLTSSSQPGVAMKVREAGVIIGRALEPYDGSIQVSGEVKKIEERAKEDGKIITPPQEDTGKIMVFVNLSWYDPDVYLTSAGELNIRMTPNENSPNESEYSLVDTAGKVIERVGAFAEIAVANLRAGLIETQSLITNSLITNYLTANVGIISPLVETDTLNAKQLNTNVISPLPDSSDIVIQLGSSDPGSEQSYDPGSPSGFGKLLIQNSQGETVASIDSSGNASFSGQVTGGRLQATAVDSRQLTVDGDATIAGTLYADEVVARKGTFGELLGKVDSLLAGSDVKQQETNQEQTSGDVEKQQSDISLIESHSLTPLSTQTENIQSAPLNPTPISNTESAGLSSEGINQGITSEPKNNLPTSADNPETTLSWNEFSETPTNSQSNTSALELSSNWEISDPSQDLKITSNLKVLGRTSLADTSIAGSLNVDGTLVIADSSINSLSGTLYLQNLGLGGIDILAGKVVIDVDGNVQIAGNLTVGGEISASKLAINAKGSEFGKLLEVKNPAGEIVASIDSSGSAQFAQVETKKLVIANNSEQSTMNSEQSANFETNATAGQAILPAGETELQITNYSITNNSLIYLTPISDTQNKVLYVKAKKGGEEFTAAIDVPIDSDIEFNYWIIN